jgi:hypothetical protein
VESKEADKRFALECRSSRYWEERPVSLLGGRDRVGEMNTMVARSAEVEVPVPRIAGETVEHRRERGRRRSDRNGASSGSEAERASMMLTGMTPTSLARRLGPRT